MYWICHCRQPTRRFVQSQFTSSDRPVVIIGAGPAGLTAAYELTQHGASVVILEQDDQVGGLARTVHYKGFRFDIGGHRFFTKVAPVERLWRMILGKDFLRRPRLSRIYYRGRFFDYPLKPLNALRNLGLWTSVTVMASCLWIKLRPIKPEVSFADWVSNRFGRRLFHIFFETYTEKVWGMPCHSIGAQWAAQRIKGLSLKTAVISMLCPAWIKKDGEIKSLIEDFEYPRLGPGMMWDAFRDRIEEAGAQLKLNSRIVKLIHDGERITDVEFERDGARFTQPASHVISTMPVRHLVKSLSPEVPKPVVAAAERLKYRDFLTVALIIDQPDVFPDNWIYVHDERVQVGRVQNFKNWSPDMVPDPRLTCLGMEYFCFAGDGLWNSSDADLIALATRELEAIGLVAPGLVRDGAVVRAPKAYPVYDEGFEGALEEIKAHLARFDNLQMVGRNGMHKYNNQDHSMLTAILAVRNLFGERNDLWAVNADEEYHEEHASSESVVRERREISVTRHTQPAVPRLRSL
jgi:protoporphyrinogen oxidase